MANDNLLLKTPLYELWGNGNGIFIFRWDDGVVITLDAARETVEKERQLTTNGPHCILINLEGIQSMDREARKYYATVNGPEAVALVGVSPVARVIGNIFMGINRHPTIPVRMFSSEEDAILWLETFIP